MKLFIKDTILLDLMAKKFKETKNQLKTKKNKKNLNTETNTLSFMRKSIKPKIN